MSNENENCTARQQIGQRAGIAGIAVNTLLFLAKCAVGLAGNSISVLADALNNLTDSASSLVTLVGFRLCGKQADARHPNGYGRMEYVSGFLVSLFIMVTALSFGKTALTRVAEPQAAEVPAVLMWIPLTAIALKLLLAFYTDSVNKKIESAALKAMIKDCLSDAVLTCVTIASTLFSPYTSLPLDGLSGLLISGMILWTGYTSFREHTDLLLGKGGDPILIERIKGIIQTQEDIFRGVTSVSVFDYGPEKQLAYIQVELNACPCSEAVQAGISKTIQELKDLLSLEATIYWDTAASAALIAAADISKPVNSLCPPADQKAPSSLSEPSSVE